MGERTSGAALVGADGRAAIRRALVDGSTPTQGLDPASLAALEGAFEAVRAVPARRDVAPEGEAAGALHLLLEGWAVRTSLMTEGRRHLSAVFLPGDLCDPERTSLDPPGYGLTAVTACVVAVAPRPRLAALVDDDPAIRRALTLLQARGHADTLAHAASLGLRTAPERVAYLFCTLAKRMAPGRPHLDQFPFPLTQEELAEATGLSVVHVNRTLQTLRGAGLIILEGRRLKLPDWSALCTYARVAPGG